MAESLALGASVDLLIVPLDGAPIAIKGDLVSSTDVSPPAFSRNEMNASMTIAGPTVGSVLTVGDSMTSIFGSEAEESMATASAQVHDLGLNLAGLFSFLETNASQMGSSAEVQGSCCGGLTATGSTTVADAFLKCLIGDGIALPSNPEPNTQILHDMGIRTILNEQVVEGDGSADLRLAVNAARITLDQVLVTGLGSVSGEVIIGRSVAGLSCSGQSCGTCTGDCDGNCIVSIDELVLGVNIALDHMAVGACRATDPNASQNVTVDELVTDVQNLLFGCPANRNR